MKKFAIGILGVAAVALLAAELVALRGLHVVAARAPSGSSSAQMGGASSASHGAIVRFASNAVTAPPFLLPDLNGQMISTADWHDKVVLLNFFATWCAPCREEIPELIELANRYKGHLQIVAISIDEAPPAEVKEFAQRFGINYSVVMSSPEMIDEYGGVPALPTCFVISPQGRVVQKHVGLYPMDVYETEVRALLGMPVHATVETFQDTGQVFLKNASLATELPGVDLKKLNESQKKAVLKRLNAENCDCGCKLTLAQCRINDPSCPISPQTATEIVRQVLGGAAPKAKQAASQ